MQNEGSSPSGSRWEPTSQPEVGGRQAPPPAADVLGGRQVVEPRRRRWHAVAAVLTTLVGVGAVTAGGAYAQGVGSTPSHPTGAPTSQVAGDGGGRYARDAAGDAHGPLGDHRRGRRPGDEQRLPSGDPS